MKLYTINEEYIEFLRKFDKKVPHNKNENRPYVGVVLKIKNHNYFAPLSSPKKKHLKMTENITFIKIKGGEYGVINLNNMIPIQGEHLKIKPIQNKENTKDLYKLFIKNNIDINRLNNKKNNIDISLNRKNIEKASINIITKGKFKKISKKIEELNQKNIFTNTNNEEKKYISNRLEKSKIELNKIKSELNSPQGKNRKIRIEKSIEAKLIKNSKPWLMEKSKTLRNNQYKKLKILYYVDIARLFIKI